MQILKWTLPLHILSPSDRNANSRFLFATATANYNILVINFSRCIPSNWTKQQPQPHNSAWWVKNCVWVYISSQYICAMMLWHTERVCMLVAWIAEALIGFGQLKTVLIIVWLPTPSMSLPPSPQPSSLLLLLLSLSLLPCSGLPQADFRNKIWLKYIL